MTFNQNLDGMGGRASSGGSSGGSGGLGGFGLGSGSGKGGGNSGMMTLLMSVIGSKFGIPGVIVVAAIAFFAGGGTGMFDSGSSNVLSGGDNVTSSSSLEHCDTWEDANNFDDCRIEGTAISLDNVWSQILPAETGISYTEPKVVIGDGNVSTGCGQASTIQTGPFYCPGDRTVYVGPSFFTQLKQMGGSDGSFSQMYVIAHEFGHHIQNLQGTIGLSDYNNAGEDSNAVKMELQADCYAGVWANHADSGDQAMLDPLTDAQVAQAIQSAQAIGDDAIQSASGSRVNPDKWTHGSSAQRQQWFLNGYRSGSVNSCAQNFQR